MSNMHTICMCIAIVTISVNSVVSLPSSGISTVENAVLRTLQSAESIVIALAHDIHMATGCTCAHFTCGCCSHLELQEIHLNSTICSNVTYLSEDYGISFTVTLDQYTLFNETVSARNPPPVCTGAPFVKELAEVCVRLYDIQATKRSLHACAAVEARMKHILLAKYELGCFNMGNRTLLGTAKDVGDEIIPSVIML